LRVVIAEDQFLLRDGLIRLLEAYGFEVAAAVDNGDDLLTEVRASRPDVAVVDVRLPPTFTDEGLRAALQARRELPGLPVLVLSQYVEQLYARELLADGAGAVGYLLKDRVLDGGQFTDAVKRVADGGTVMDPEVIARLLARNAGTQSPIARASAKSSSRWPRAARTRPSPSGWSSPSAPSPSTPPRSSPSSICSSPTTTTAVSSPSSRTWASNRPRATPVRSTY
jgi:DNA-binding NarL/FixJ family response regulator